MPNTSWNRDNPKPSKSEKYQRFAKKVDARISRIAAEQAKPQNHGPTIEVRATLEVPQTTRRIRGWG